MQVVGREDSPSVLALGSSVYANGHLKVITRSSMFFENKKTVRGAVIAASKVLCSGTPHHATGRPQTGRPISAMLGPL